MTARRSLLGVSLVSGRLSMGLVLGLGLGLGLVLGLGLGATGCGDDGQGPTDAAVVADQGTEGFHFTDSAWPDAKTYFDQGVQPDQGPVPDGGPQPDQPLVQPDQGPPPPDQFVPTCTKNSDCDDSLSCTTDTCTGGKCTYTVNANFCAIAGKCIAISTLNPSDGCQKCDPTKNAWAWSNYVCTKLYAGAGTYGFLDGTTAQARFWNPRGVALGPSGEVYVADSSNHRIRMISGGLVSTLAGSGYGYADGAAAAAKFRFPMGVAVGLKGEVYVADNDNHRIRKIEKGVVSTFAGAGSGFLDGTTAQAKFTNPYDVAVGKSGEVYVADYNNHRIRMISGGLVSTLAGSGKAGNADGAAAAAQFYSPAGVAVDSTGTVYVTDYSSYSNRIRKIASGVVSTVVSSGYLINPSGIDVAASGTIYVADRHRIRTVVSGKVSTLAGSTSYGYVNSPTLDVRFDDPWGIVLSGTSTLYVADRDNHRIRRITW